jgi:NAD dependent epimerase/dehydratase family enzyme
MAEIVTDSQNAVPERALALGHSFRHATLEGALVAALG